MSGGQGKEVDVGMSQSGGIPRPCQRMEVDSKRSGLSERQPLPILLSPVPLEHSSASHQSTEYGPVGDET